MFIFGSFLCLISDLILTNLLIYFLLGLKELPYYENMFEVKNLIIIRKLPYFLEIESYEDLEVCVFA